MTEHLLWKLRRIADGKRQRDIAAIIGVSPTYYSAVERGEQRPTDLERRLIERFLPRLPIRAFPCDDDSERVPV